MENDPLEGAGQAHDCDNGWMWVSRKYAEHLAERVNVEGSTPASAVIAALANSVYPCRECRPTQFFRWAQGHFAPDHDIGSCPDCLAAGSGIRPQRRRGKAAPARPAAQQEPPWPPEDDGPEPTAEPADELALTPPPRRDLD